MTFGQIMKAVRKNENMSQKEMAHIMFVGQSYISQIENEKVKPTDMFEELFFLKFPLWKQQE